VNGDKPILFAVIKDYYPMSAVDISILKTVLKSAVVMAHTAVK